LSYGDEKFKPLAGLFHRLTTGAFKSLRTTEKPDRSIYFAFRGCALARELSMISSQ
jgi:hypothetical protein